MCCSFGSGGHLCERDGVLRLGRQCEGDTGPHLQQQQSLFLFDHNKTDSLKTAAVPHLLVHLNGVAERSLPIVLHASSNFLWRNGDAVRAEEEKVCESLVARS